MKQLDRNGLQGNKEFLNEVKALSLLTHQNLVKFNGYCADGDQRILVYEYMPGGSLEDCLFGMYPQPKVNFKKFQINDPAWYAHWTNSTRHDRQIGSNKE